MWEKLVAWLRLQWDTGKSVEELQIDVEHLQANERSTHDFMQALATKYESQLKDNEMLRQEIMLLSRELEQERRKREDELEKMELRLRLLISEELRRLPPSQEE